MVEIRTSVIKIKNVFDGHMRRLGMAELEDITIETSKTERRKIVGKEKEYPRTVRQVMVQGIPCINKNTKRGGKDQEQ